MKIAILKTGSLPEILNDRFKSYPEMLIELIGQYNFDISFETISCIDNIFPNKIEDFDGYIITGSPYGVYDKEEWITNLFKLIRTIYKQSIPLVGICFGHQAIAFALGGKVIKSEKGWGVGIKKMFKKSNSAWINKKINTINLIYSHQDQVITLPKNAKILFGNTFCPISSYSIGNKVFSIQGHPEFENNFALELLELRKDKIESNKYTIAKKSLSEKNHDGKEVGKMVINFFKNR
tara:strand:- start:121 stop:828 length:708 start_codon:yes stop_codon:yes gene_type:complete